MKEDKNSIRQKDLRCGPGEFDRFQNSPVWYDMRNLIKDRIEVLQDMFLSAQTMEEMKHVQGQMLAWKEMTKLPSYLKQCAHMEANLNKENTEKDEH